MRSKKLLSVSFVIILNFPSTLAVRFKACYFVCKAVDGLGKLWLRDKVPGGLDCYF